MRFQGIASLALLVLLAVIHTCACGALSTARQPTAARWPKLLQGRAASRAAHGCLPAVAMSTIDVEEIAVREQLCSAALCPNGRLCSHRISTYCCHPVLDTGSRVN